MKTLCLIATLVAASSASFAASAQTSNTINFKGEIVASGCSVSSSSVAGGAQNQAAKATGIDVDLGTVSAADIGSAGTAFSGAAMPVGAGANVSLNFDCGAATAGGASGGAPTKFTVIFNPKASDIDSGSAGTLKVAGGATGVAIALFQNEQLINITNSQPVVTGQIANGKGVMNLRAMYVRNSDTLKPGKATASLPFTLRYE
jgi:type 1 fimbria pilin